MNASFQLPRFYPIIDTAALRSTSFSPIQIAEQTAAAGVRILQYRHKDNWTQSEFDEAKAISEICQQAKILFVINDRADFAYLLGAALHIGQDDLPPAASRKIVGSAVIGFSTHNAAQLRHAVDAPVDYLSLGPIFATSSKARPDPVVRIDGLRALRPLSSKPLVAIGGITLENASEVLAAGADSVAIISGIIPSEPNQLRERLKEWRRTTKDS
jgi:thiamine-phosphate pyrophosphorylase